MNILIASSEVFPFAKTGGLADVCGALPIELARQGHQPIVFMPAYRSIHEVDVAIDPTDVSFDIPIGSKIVPGRLLTGRLPGSEVPVFFVDQPDYYDRRGVYMDSDGEYRDNCERYVFFCRAVMESIRLLNLQVDILHCNDWPTGLIPAYLEIEYRHAKGYESIGSVLTIHNLAYQGSFWHWDMALTGLDWKYFNWHQMEFFNQLNLLKTGIVFADAITTVSPQYAREIQGPDLGCGLEGVLAHRRHVLSGIINGVDYGIWNPEVDPHLPIKFGPSNWREGKATCKRALQEQLRLPQRGDVPLIGLIGRLAEQKGWDLVIRALLEWLPQQDVQWVILGTGEDRYAQALRRLASEFPEKISAQLAFSNELSHRIEAAADIFLMPSRYEPCGLNQLYSLKYGTIPVVHATGGLVDTITDTNRQTLLDGQATGFKFHDFSPNALHEALLRAVELYRHNRLAWERLVQTGMAQDWSWAKSAREYHELYLSTLERRQGVSYTASQS